MHLTGNVWGFWGCYIKASGWVRAFWYWRTLPDKNFPSLKRKMYLHIYLSISLRRSLSSSHRLPSLGISYTTEHMVNIWDLFLPMNQVSFSEWVGILPRKKKWQCLSPFSELHWMMSTLGLRCSNRLIHVKSSWFAFQRLTPVSSDFHFELWWICCWTVFFPPLFFAACKGWIKWKSCYFFLFFLKRW